MDLGSQLVRTAIAHERWLLRAIQILAGLSCTDLRIDLGEVGGRPRLVLRR